MVPAVLHNGQLGWAATDYDTVRALLADRRFSSDRTRPGYPQSAKGRTVWLAGMDAPQHTRARRDVIGEFTHKRLATLRPAIRRVVNSQIDALVSGPRPADLVAAFALPVPSMVICELLDVPYRDHELFEGQTRDLMATDPAVISRAGAALRDYLSQLVRDKQRKPGEDLISRQVLKLRALGRENHHELVELAFVLLTAGHETIANMISLSVLALLENPDVLAEIKSDNTKTPAAVEELLRLITIVETSIGRVATKDIDLAGVRIRSGQGVVALATLANHDPSLFRDPARLNINRKDNNKHLAFGHGPHRCLGEGLARMELEIALNLLFTRLPTLRLARPATELTYRDVQLVFGLDKLPITWT